MSFVYCPKCISTDVEVWSSHSIECNNCGHEGFFPSASRQEIERLELLNSMEKTQKDIGDTLDSIFKKLKANRKADEKKEDKKPTV